MNIQTATAILVVIAVTLLLDIVLDGLHDLDEAICRELDKKEDNK